MSLKTLSTSKVPACVDVDVVDVGVGVGDVAGWAVRLEVLSPSTFFTLLLSKN